MALLGGRKTGLWSRVKQLALTDVGALMRGLKGNEIEALEQLFLEADFGVPATMELVEFLETQVRKGTLRNESQLRAAVGEELQRLLATPFAPDQLFQPPAGTPLIILMIGVNGVGKTTSLAKLARRFQGQGKRVMVAAGDTWRAGAVAQLEVWAERLGVECVSGKQGGDPAAVAFDAVEAAVARKVDICLIDTAGRLHTQDRLMEELRKVVRVIDRRLPGAPQEVFLVLDGTVGQNAVQQGKLFRAVVAPTGLIVTKLDGTARGGAVVALRRELDTPIRYIGLGEGEGDLEPFLPHHMATLLLEGE